MVVVSIGARLVTRAAITEIVALNDAGIFEEAHGAIHCRNRDAIINLGTAAVKLFDIRMVVGLCQDARDHAALFGHAHPFGCAERLDILPFGDVFTRLGHAVSLPSVSTGVLGFPIILTVSAMCPLVRCQRSRRSTSAAALPSCPE